MKVDSIALLDAAKQRMPLLYLTMADCLQSLRQARSKVAMATKLVEYENGTLIYFGSQSNSQDYIHCKVLLQIIMNPLLHHPHLVFYHPHLLPYHPHLLLYHPHSMRVILI